MERFFEFGRRARILLIVAATGLGFLLTTEASVWWAPLAASPLVWVPLYLPFRWSIRVGLSTAGLGVVLLMIGKPYVDEIFLLLTGLGAVITIAWETIAFLMQPFFKKSG